MATPRKKTKSGPAKKSRVASGKTGARSASKSAAESPAAAKKPKSAAASKSPKSRTGKTEGVDKPAKKSARASSTEKPRPRARPKLTAADRKWQAAIREALVRQRDEMLSVVQSTQAQMAQRVGDHADVSDRASDGFEDELAAGLMAIEAAQLEDIEAAIRRIDAGEYGLCIDCEKPIPRKRLEVLPFARRCLNCESSTPRYGRAKKSAYFENDDD